MNCPTCGHPAADHSRLAGCLQQGCACATTPSAIRADITPTPTRAQQVAATDAAIAQVDAAADAEFLERATQTVRRLAQQGHPFTTDDVWEALRVQEVPAPREPRALGPVMRRAIRDQVISPTGTWAASRRRHGAPLQVYTRGASA